MFEQTWLIALTCGSFAIKSAAAVVKSHGLGIGESFVTSEIFNRQADASGWWSFTVCESAAKMAIPSAE